MNMHQYKRRKKLFRIWGLNLKKVEEPIDDSIEEEILFALRKEWKWFKNKERNLYIFRARYICMEDIPSSSLTGIFKVTRSMINLIEQDALKRLRLYKKEQT